MIMKTFAPLWIINAILMLTVLSSSSYLVLLCLGRVPLEGAFLKMAIWAFALGVLFYKRELKVREARLCEKPEN